MVVILSVSLIVWAGLFVWWFLMPEFGNLPYYLVHMYPIMHFLIAFFLKHLVRQNKPKLGVFMIVFVPFIIWLISILFIAFSDLIL